MTQLHEASAMFAEGVFPYKTSEELVLPSHSPNNIQQDHMLRPASEYIILDVIELITLDVLRNPRIN